MKGPLYISDDEKKQGTQAEVEAYEKALNPLATYMFPYHSGYILGATTSALLNLMPLVEELRQVIGTYAPNWRNDGPASKDFTAVRALLLAYEKALGIEQPS